MGGDVVDKSNVEKCY